MDVPQGPVRRRAPRCHRLKNPQQGPTNHIAGPAPEPRVAEQRRARGPGSRLPQLFQQRPPTPLLVLARPPFPPKGGPGPPPPRGSQPLGGQTRPRWTVRGPRWEVLPWPLKQDSGGWFLPTPPPSVKIDPSPLRRSHGDRCPVPGPCWAASLAPGRTRPPCGVPQRAWAGDTRACGLALRPSFLPAGTLGVLGPMTVSGIAGGKTVLREGSGQGAQVGDTLDPWREPGQGFSRGGSGAVGGGVLWVTVGLLTRLWFPSFLYQGGQCGPSLGPRLRTWSPAGLVCTEPSCVCALFPVICVLHFSPWVSPFPITRSPSTFSIPPPPGGQ